jgi:hypothetical protein
MFKRLLFAILATSLLAACGGPPAETTTQAQSEPTEATTSEPETSNEPETATPDVTPVGTELAVRGDRAITVTGSEVVDIITINEFFPPIEAKGGKLAIVYLNLKNIGNESGNMFFTQFKLVDDQGREYSELQDFEEIGSLYLWLEEKGLASPDDQLFPGGEAQSARVFRVAPDAEGLQLSVNNKLMAIE